MLNKVIYVHTNIHMYILSGGKLYCSGDLRGNTAGEGFAYSSQRIFVFYYVPPLMAC